ncbi:hypothetical protein RGQ29_032109 [Quercus rubra]|uniref:Uncharacterized protein n=1 Tax=Quercus rubra TaxID=3512 RepID=A0AAN7I591_QUERU|nr:hypothetical protein RGQ29_032109 [Quercus rubra]
MGGRCPPPPPPSAPAPKHNPRDRSRECPKPRNPTIKFTALLSSQLIILVTKPLLLDLSSTSAAIMASAERCKRAATMKTLEAWPLGKESCFLYEKAGLVFML